MTAQRGDGILLKVGNGATPEVFTAAAGLKTASVTINKEQVDITSADDTDKWRRLLTGASNKSLSVSGSGVLKDDAVMTTIITSVLADTYKNWQVVIPGAGTFQGPCQVNISYAGDHNGEATYDITLQSAGQMDFA